MDNFGQLPKGKYNLITDVPGVMVGHVTLEGDGAKTGVTAILPHGGNLFRQKVVANAHVINGFGKTIGINQVQELGNLETPIILTNTLSAGMGAYGLVSYMLEQNPDIGDTTGTVNPVVGECNDGEINNIRKGYVQKQHIKEAIVAALNNEPEFGEGAVGAGRGMIAYGLKGGIGSSSRQVGFGPDTFTVGVLVLANFGQKQWLVVDGEKVGQKLEALEKNQAIVTTQEAEELVEEKKDNLPLEALPIEYSITNEKGSVIVIVATDIPMSSRQLGRVAKRAVAGLARTGSYIGQGSGDVVIAFSTANSLNHEDKAYFTTFQKVNEDKLDRVFRSTVEATEEAVISAMYHAKEDVKRDGTKVQTLTQVLEKLSKAGSIAPVPKQNSGLKGLFNKMFGNK